MRTPARWPIVVRPLAGSRTHDGRLDMSLLTFQDNL